MLDQEPLLQQESVSMFCIGRDSRGNWVIQDQSGLRGGLFVSCAEALRFARFENGDRPRAVMIVPDILELDMKPKSFQGACPTERASRQDLAA